MKHTSFQHIMQTFLKNLLNIFGLIYITLERYVVYPDDENILGVDIDNDLFEMSRKQLCRYMDAVLPRKGFFDVQSTTKIRFGCQLLRNFHLMKRKLKDKKDKKYDTSTAYNPLEYS